MIKNTQKSMFRSLLTATMMFFVSSMAVLGQAGNISAPTGIVVTANNNTSVTFSFTVGTVTNTTLSSVEYTLGTSTAWASTTTSTVTGTTSGTFSATVEGLTTGTTYTMNIRVVGTNTTTTSAATSFQFTTSTLTAPTDLVLTPSWKQLSLAFSTPSSDGGNGITSYEYSVNSGTWVSVPVPAVGSPIVIPNLNNGTQYSVRLRAVNSKGPGTTSTAVTGTPIAVANEPVITSINRANNGLAVTFTAPSVTTNADFSSAVPVTTYQFSTDNGLTWLTRSDTVTPTHTVLTINGLEMNTSYQVRLRAVNAVGNGAASVMTQATTHNLTAPTNVTLTPGNNLLTVSLTAPTTSTHPDPITSYQYKVGNADWVATSTASTTFTITGLNNGVTYTVLVRAVNGGGVGASSAAVTGVPRGSAVAYVQFIHNNSSVGSVDVFAEGTSIRNDLEAGKATGFLIVDGNEPVAISVTNADNTTTLGTFTQTFTTNAYYVVVLQGGLNSKPFEMKLIENVRNVSNVATAVQYRFFNGFSDLSSVNLQRVSTSTPRVPEGPNQGLVGVGVAYGAATGYYSHDVPGFTTIQVVSGGSVAGQFMFDLGSYDGKTLTLVGTGLKNGENATALNLLAYDVNGNVIAPKVSTDNGNEGTQLPSEFVLYSNFPNPFNPTTSIRFDLPEMANVRIEVIDLLGRQVMLIPNQSMTAGSNKVVTLNASRLSSGVYFYKVIAEGANKTFVQASKFTLLK